MKVCRLFDYKKTSFYLTKTLNRNESVLNSQYLFRLFQRQSRLSYLCGNKNSINSKLSRSNQK